MMQYKIFTDKKHQSTLLCVLKFTPSPMELFVSASVYLIHIIFCFLKS
jgi:hypothetical protein